MRAGVRDVKNNLSRYLRRISRGDRILITAHDRVVAELVAPGAGGHGPDAYRALITGGTIRPAAEKGDPLEDWPDIRLPRGTGARLIAEDRDEE